LSATKDVTHKEPEDMATETTIPHSFGEATLAELEQGLSGQLVRPGDKSYDEARAIWNGAHDRRPDLIVRCAGVADVMRAVDFARSENLVIAVRGGGHSLPGFSTSDGGLVIDLSGMTAVRVDPERRTAVAEGGCTWAELDHETQAFGLAVTGGLISTTGIAGFTLGGGIGWLMRRFGLACDNLIAADVVTADGQLVHASEHENPDLLWGLRRGGGNFGIATSLEYRLHPVGPMVLAGPIFFAGDRAEEVLRFYRDWVRDLPDEVTTMVNLTTAPPAPFLPEAVHGKPIVAVIAVHAGEPESGRALVQPLKDLGDPIADLIGDMPYTTMQTLLDPLWPRGVHNYMRSAYVDELTDAAIEATVARHDAVPSPMSEIHLQHFGGAVARVGDDHAAFGNRTAQYVLNVVARTPEADGFAENVAWARGTAEDLAPVSRDGAYVNFMGDAGDERLRASYGDATYERLVALKRRYDPANLFRLNQNITP
jgi:FAD/FMN-containing dehydrogenase